MSVGCTDVDFRTLMDSHEALRSEVIRANADVANCCDKRDDLRAEVARLTRERDADTAIVEAAIAQQERAAAIENRAQYAQAMEDKKQEVEHQLTAQRAKAGKQREALCQQARKHLPEAVSAIYERVLQHGNR